MGLLDYSYLRVLLIDEGSLSRSVLATMLREIGLQDITQTVHPLSARKYLADDYSKYDLIVCDYHFNPNKGVTMTGQDLLEELRQSKGLPMSTAFIMITDEARYQYVADSIEGALDDYILKPFSVTDFEKRLETVLSRKKYLAHVFEAIELEEYDRATSLCYALCQQPDNKHKIYAARIGSELYLRLGNYDRAKELFEFVIKEKALPWAKLGLAKVKLDQENNATAASRALESLIQESPKYADAYDVLGRAQIESLKFEDAYATFERATRLTPGSLMRLQKFGMLAFLLGKTPQAKKALEGALALGYTSKAFDFNVLAALALIGFDTKEQRAWDRYKKRIQQTREKYPKSYRLIMVENFILAAEYLSENKMDALTDLVKKIALDIKKPEFDFEMACNFMHILIRLTERDFDFIELNDWVTDLSNRFCVSKPSSKILELVVEPNENLHEIVKGGFDRINTFSRTALTYALTKDYNIAVSYLLKASASVLNARLFAVTGAMIERYSEHLDTSFKDEAKSKLKDLSDKFASYGTHARSDVKLRTPVQK